MEEKYKKSIILSAILFVISIFAILAPKKLVFAEKSAIDSVQDYLEVHGISYRAVTESEQTIMAELISQGEGRCTLEDVKALQALNEALQCDERLDEVKGLQVMIYDINDELIYDVYTARNPLINEQKRAEAYSLVSEETLKEKATTLMNDYSCEIKEVSYTNQDTGISKLELKVKVTQEAIASMLDISALSSKIMVDFCNDGLSQLIVNMESTNGECFSYVIVDFWANECNAWISPDVKEDFNCLAGPPVLPQR